MFIVQYCFFLRYQMVNGLTSDHFIKWSDVRLNIISCDHVHVPKKITRCLSLLIRDR